jgi:OmpA-OmpF porin, OOP family
MFVGIKFSSTRQQQQMGYFFWSKRSRHKSKCCLERCEKSIFKYFDAKENWNIIPSVSYLNVSRYVGDGFSFGVNRICKQNFKFVNDSRVKGMEQM